MCGERDRGRGEWALKPLQPTVAVPRKPAEKAEPLVWEEEGPEQREETEEEERRSGAGAGGGGGREESVGRCCCRTERCVFSINPG